MIEFLLWLFGAGGRMIDRGPESTEDYSYRAGGSTGGF